MQFVVFTDEKDAMDVPELKIGQAYVTFHDDGGLADVFVARSMAFVGTFCVERFSKREPAGSREWVALQAIAEAGATCFPGKTVPQILQLMQLNTGLTFADILDMAWTVEQIKKEVHFTHLLETEYHPEDDDEDEREDDPKYDMGYWRTGIRVRVL